MPDSLADRVVASAVALLGLIGLALAIGARDPMALIFGVGLAGFAVLFTLPRLAFRRRAALRRAAAADQA